MGYVASNKTVMFVFGTRPEAIKMIPVVETLSNVKDLSIRICVTGQHREMLDQIINPLGLKVDFDLDVMSENQDLTDVTSKILLGMKQVFSESKPNLILVHGDTTTAAAGALAAFYAGIPVAHVEAGLRTHTIASPFPEELNRQIVGRIASLHFAPTQLSRENLISEGIDKSRIFVTGNTVVDSLTKTLNAIDNSVSNSAELKSLLNNRLSFDTTSEDFVLITAHRRENIGPAFEDILQAIKILAEKYPEVYFVYPVHMNPNIRKPVFQNLSDVHNIKLVEPFSQSEFAYLLRNSLFVLTDSGGIQEEAPILGKPVVLMRESTERPEAVQHGAAVLVGTDQKKIIETCTKLISRDQLFTAMSVSRDIFGDGKASLEIKRQILSYLN